MTFEKYWMSKNRSTGKALGLRFSTSIMEIDSRIGSDVEAFTKINKGKIQKV